MAGKSPTQRTLQECRRRGWHAGVVERWNPHARVRHDLFGFADIVAITCDLRNAPGPPPVGPQLVAIQATSGGNVSSRMKKVAARREADAWVAAGGRVEVWGWRSRKVKRGGKAVRWAVRIMRLVAPGEWGEVEA